jgi:hypothetical protein
MRSIITVYTLLGAAICSHAATINVAAGGDFQAALNAANPGDTIVLQAGAVYNTAGAFTLPNKGSSTQVITIESSAFSSLPAAGYRVRPADAVHMPKLVSTINAEAVLDAAPGAHHYRLQGIEFTVAPTHWAYVLVKLGMGTETLRSQQPHDITLDRCYIHGDPVALPGTKRGVGLEGAAQAVLNSYISEIHAQGQDSQAIASFNGAGPFQIINNYLEASTENLLFGGADPKIPNLVPTDIQILNNYLFKPLSWHASGIPWSVKNLFELKNADRVIVDGNVFENNWLNAQTGFAILMKSVNQDGNCPWCGTSNVTFTHNIIRHSGSGLNMVSMDGTNATPMRSVRVRDNIFEDINQSVFGGDGRLFQFLGTANWGSDIHVDHNSAFHNGSGNAFISIGDSGKFTDGFSFNDNLVTYGSYGLHSPLGEGTAGLNAFVLNYTFAGNGIIGGGSPSKYPAGNFFPPDLASVGFADFAGGDYHLTSASPYKGAGTDGKDPGADIDTVLAATCGAIYGIPTSACSTYVPPPPPPAGGNLSLNLPAYLPLKAEISAQYQGSVPASRFVWNFTPITRIPSRHSAPALAGGAAAASLTTSSPQASLGGVPLALGPYLISVQAYSPSGTVSAAQAYVTLVPADLDQVRVYPNPWRADRHASIPVTFDRLTVNTTIKIFTVAGHWVKTLPTSSTSVTWDLTNDDGEKAASGLYLYLLQTDSGDKKTGKIAVIK